MKATPMTTEKVVAFPKAKAARGGPKTDAELSADIYRAWRKVARAIKAASLAGLKVETCFSGDRYPTIVRKL